jgi:hypothetical protein
VTFKKLYAKLNKKRREGRKGAHMGGRKIC